MTELLRLSAVGLTGGLLAVTLRKERSDMALLVALVTSVIIALRVVTATGELLGDINNIISQCGVDIKYFALCIKAVGVAYVSQFASELLRDSGESAIASKVEAAGKVSILLLTMPVILSFLQMCVKVVKGI